MKRNGKQVLLLCLLWIAALILYQIYIGQFVIPDDLKPVVIIKDDREEDFMPDWNALLAENKDTVGYLIIEGTGIHTPVVQGSDNDFYLYHNFQGESDEKGTLFLDSNYSFTEPKGVNSVIYGHSNMRNGDYVPFDDLHNYRSMPFLIEHELIRFDRPPEAGGNGLWQVVAILEVDKDFDYRRSDFKDKEDFESYYEAIICQSIIEMEEPVRYGDEMLTLSTCGWPSPNGRLAIIAKRINKEGVNQ